MRLSSTGLYYFSRQRCGLPPSRASLEPGRSLVGCSVHHGGEVGPPRRTFAAGRETVRAWYNFHVVERGWADIAYHLLIDANGRLYAGRPIAAIPAAVLNHNTGTVAINFMQDGDKYGLTRAQRATLKILFERGVSELGIPPLRTLDTRGHREYDGHRTNRCPGDKIMDHLSWRRDRY